MMCDAEQPGAYANASREIAGFAAAHLAHRDVLRIDVTEDSSGRRRPSGHSSCSVPADQFHLLSHGCISAPCRRPPRCSAAAGRQGLRASAVACCKFETATAELDPES